MNVFLSMFLNVLEKLDKSKFYTKSLEEKWMRNSKIFVRAWVLYSNFIEKLQ